MKLLALIVAILLVAGVAYAEDTSGATYTGNSDCKGCTNLAEFLNEQDCIDHSHQYEKEETDYALGVGVDLVVYQADPERTGAKKLIPDAVEVQNKYDFANENGSTYVVAKYNIWDLFQKKAE